MSDAKAKKKVGKFLEKMKEAGAEVQTADKPRSGQKISAKAIRELTEKTAAPADFGAWVSWTMSF